MDTPVTKFLVGSARRPYKDLIQHHIRKQNEEKLEFQNISHLELLPNHLKQISELFFDDINLLATSKEFWKNNCEEAFSVIIEKAIEHFPIEGLMPTVQDSKVPFNQQLAFFFFNWATINFAYSASKSKELRELIGIKKGIIFR